MNNKIRKIKKEFFCEVSRIVSAHRKRCSSPKPWSNKYDLILKYIISNILLEYVIKLRGSHTGSG
jgi:hypothetical protein